MKKLAFILVISSLLLFSCAEQQPQQPTTIESRARGLANALQNLITNTTDIDSYVKTLSTDQDVSAKKSEFINQLRATISTLGNKVEYLGIYETKATLIYSFDISMKPDDVDKVYLLHLMLKNTSSQTRAPYTIPFITLKGDNEIYLAVIFKKNEIVYVYPKPIVQ